MTRKIEPLVHFNASNNSPVINIQPLWNRIILIVVHIVSERGWFNLMVILRLWFMQRCTGLHHTKRCNIISASFNLVDLFPSNFHSSVSTENYVDSTSLNIDSLKQSKTKQKPLPEQKLSNPNRYRMGIKSVVCFTSPATCKMRFAT